MIDSTVKTTVMWLGGLIVGVAGGTLGFDARYAKAETTEKAIAAVERGLKSEMAAQRAYTEGAFLRQRKNQLEDKVFELDAKRDARKIDQVERKQLFRYKAELDDVNRELRIKR